MTKLLQYTLLISMLTVSSVAIAAPDAEMPVQIVSDHANFDNLKGKATYIGNVKVEQGSRELYANKLTLFRGEDNRIKLMIATGKPATFKVQEDKNTPPGSGKANTIKYYPQLNKVDLIEDASLTKNGDTVSGPKLTYNFVTQELEGAGSKQERTTVILQPKRVP